MTTTLACCASVGGTVLRLAPLCEGGSGACCTPPFGCCIDTTQSWCMGVGGAYFANDTCSTIVACPGTMGPAPGP